MITKRYGILIDGGYTVICSGKAWIYLPKDAASMQRLVFAYVAQIAADLEAEKRAAA